MPSIGDEAVLLPFARHFLLPLLLDKVFSNRSHLFWTIHLIEREILALGFNWREARC